MIREMLFNRKDARTRVSIYGIEIARRGIQLPAKVGEEWASSLGNVNDRYYL